MGVSIFFIAFNLFISAFLFQPLTAHKASVEYCNKKANYDVKVKGVDIDPYPIARGKEAEFNISATTEKSIAKGKLVIDVTYFFFHVYEETDVLCTKTECPVTGDFVLSHKQSLPGYTPPGSYTLQMKLLGENNEELTCITFGFSIGFIPAVAAI